MKQIALLHSGILSNFDFLNLHMLPMVLVQVKKCTLYEMRLPSYAKLEVILI